MKLLKSYDTVVTKKTFTEAVNTINKKMSFRKYMRLVLYILCGWFTFLFCVVTLIVSVKFALIFF
jgi:hypothetical protein